MTHKEIVHKLKEVVAQYPADMIPFQMADIPRVASDLHLSRPVGKPLNQAVLCDVGGGIGLFSVGCAALGFRKVILIDDFQDSINQQVGDSIFSIHRHYGVRVVSRDVISKGLGDLGEQVDVVTSFDSMEHWHHSPKRLFHDLLATLRPGGRFVLGVPNCVNLRKRLSVPFGFGKWSSMQDWYEPLTFRGHVREPDVDDLRYIAKDLGLERIRIIGRNWIGYRSRNTLVRVGTHLVDHVVRFRPSLCSDLRLVGHKLAA